jgi:cell volume regulation protein A
MAVFLTLSLIQLVMNPNQSPAQLIPAFVMDMGIGAGSAFILSRIYIFLINRLKLSYEGLYPALLIALSLLTYLAATALKGNGFLAVYMTGILVGNANLLHKKTIRNFYDGTAWLMQIIMFLALGLLVFPSHIVPVIGSGLLISAFLMFVARPLSVFICLGKAKISLREKTMVSWVGLRGAVPIILATFPLLAGVPQAEIIFNIVFFIVITSVLCQGTSLPMVSRWLKVDAPIREKRTYPIEFEHTSEIDASLEEVIVPYNSRAVDKPLFEIGIPKDCLVILISRDGAFFIPNGATLLHSGDVLLALANAQALKKLHAAINTKVSS